jgi:hypothetical protein
MVHEKFQLWFNVTSALLPYIAYDYMWKLELSDNW